MTPSLAGVLLALVGFFVTFFAARALATWLKRRRADQAQQHAQQNRSRQVRRAQERAGKRAR